MDNATNYIGTADFAARNAELKRMGEEAGLRLPSTILPEGTALYDIGAEAQRKLATEVKNLPSLSDALFKVRQRIDAEAPRDVEKVLPSLVRMNQENGRVYGAGNDPKKALGYTRAGFSQLLSTIKPVHIKQGFSENLLALPPSIRAQAFEFHAKSKAGASSGITLRTIIEPNSGARVVRAVTSSKHSLENGDDGMVISALTGPGCAQAMTNAKARITRGLDRSDFEIIWPMMDRQLVVGDIALGGVRISNSETKAGALRVEAFLLRVLCANFTTAETFDLEGEELSLRHMGDLRMKLPRLVHTALKRIDPFVRAFGDAYQTALPCTRADVIAKVTKRYQLGDGFAQSIASSWDMDGASSAGDTLAGLVNALTRASQSQAMSEGVVTEKLAGRLVVEGLSWAA